MGSCYFSSSTFSRREIVEYLVDTILPTREIHLLGGPSGAGKTRWLLHTLLEWEQGKPVLGYESHPVPWVYIASDRTLDSVCRTMTSMGIEPAAITVVPAWDEKMNMFQILDEIERHKAKMAVIESFGSFVDSPPTGSNVKKYLCMVSASLRRSGLTVIGVCESPKLKPYEKYENPRQRISGAAAWAHFTETIFLIEPSDPKQPLGPGRTLNICPRNTSGRALDLCFSNNGRLLVSKLNDSIKP